MIARVQMFGRVDGSQADARREWMILSQQTFGENGLVNRRPAEWMINQLLDTRQMDDILQVMRPIGENELWPIIKRSGEWMTASQQTFGANG